MARILKITSYAVLVFSITWIGYFTRRESTVLLFSLYGAGFLAFYHLMKADQKLDTLLKFSFLLRVVLLFATPALSNDFYRFIWDGRMSILGFNPFVILPQDVAGTSQMELVGRDAEELYAGQGSLSPGNYTCYPPVNQFMFMLPAWLFPENIFFSVVVMRILLIGSDLGTVYFARKILKHMGLPESNILLFALNPFIIIELTGNLHFEGVMIFFLIASLYFMLRYKPKQSVLFFILSVSVKLIPLIFLPLFVKKTGQRALVIMTLVVLSGTLLLFLPFLTDGLFSSFLSSIDLYFRKFEFNASLYYLVRWAGYQVYGWNIIQKAGPLLGMLVFVGVLMLASIPDNTKTTVLFTSMLFSISLYYFLATTVHPWYISLPLVLSIFTRYRFPVLWSLVVVLSYSAYAHPGFRENLWLVGLEYGLVCLYLGYELVGISRRKAHKTVGQTK